MGTVSINAYHVKLAFCENTRAHMKLMVDKIVTCWLNACYINWGDHTYLNNNEFII